MIEAGAGRVQRVLGALQCRGMRSFMFWSNLGLRAGAYASSWPHGPLSRAHDDM